ncbi:hypothetical protein BD626DRAFT_576232 [Schizophyllum amplum]|uniref:F-box domain-containing protein n=1 Tax=Schizophyllum amplum TaxID=97359 RepID=A0A550BTX9_9AGAR|nr:hypothetical protein BD626DRAFT_576232 [Auriculariopsis ampla]
MSSSLAQKVAVVTGSSRSIGASIAKALAAQGAYVIVNYASSKGPADEVVDWIAQNTSGKAKAVQADMSSLAGGKALLDAAVSEWGKIDILVLNAAIMGTALFSNVTEQLYDEHFLTNVKVPLFMAQAALKHMPKPGGRLIFFSTSLCQATAFSPDVLTYIATKGAIEQITRGLAKDPAVGAAGITVNTIAPGPTDTTLFRKGKPQGVIDMITNLHPTKKLGQPEEIAPMVAFLASPAAQSDTPLLDALAAIAAQVRDSRKTIPIAELEQLATEAKNILSEVNGERNIQSPINRLPPDLLLRIFNVLRPTYSEYRPRRPRGYLKQWIAVSLVCRYWRDACLASASLWATVDMCGAPFAAAQQFVERSADAPLQLFYAQQRNITDDDKIILDGIVTHHSRRVEQLHIVTGEEIPVEVYQLFRHAMPHLRSLTITIGSGYHSDIELPTLFDSDVPLLRYLVLRRCSPWPYNRHFRNLTRLALHDLPLAVRPSVDALLDLVAASLDLEELVLIDAALDVQPDATTLESADAEQPPTVELPLLDTLQLGELPSHYCAHRLLSRLSVPDACDIRIWFIREKFTTEMSLLPVLAERALSGPIANTTALNITLDTNYRDQVVIVRAGTLYVHGCFHLPSVVGIAGGMVTKLVVAATDKGDLERWTQLLRPLRHVRELTLAGEHASLFLRALNADATLCPELGVIRVHDAELGCMLFLCMLADARAGRGAPMREMWVARNSLLGGEEAFLGKSTPAVSVMQESETRSEFVDNMIKPLYPTAERKWQDVVH